MKVFSKRRTVVAVAVIVLLLSLLRPGASRRLKSRIAASISAAVARPVEIGSVHIRLLPQPGFDLQNLVVSDDPTFGAEPMLRAPEVTAVLRLASLVRGRLEIARLELTEPSLNLVRGENGRWNLEALLERTAQAPLAPTAKAKLEPRPGFPYIEASSGRINFKMGQVKKPYALTNSDFALWQDSENSWGVRLKAQPFRSDLRLSDTGILRVDGNWLRSPNLRETPLRFSMEWDRPQLGQLTKLLTGTDKGWRGSGLIAVKLAGTPSRLRVVGDAAVRDFRRYDISSGDALELVAHCEAEYSSNDRTMRQMFCRGPVGNGEITMHGDLGTYGSHNYDLVLMAEGVPVSALVAVAQRAKKGMPEDLTSAGVVEGSLSMRENGDSGQGPQFMGSGQILGLRLASTSSKAEIHPQSVPFVVTSELGERAGGRNERRTNGRRAQRTEGPLLEFGPIPLALGPGTPATTRGWVDRSGYNIALDGEAEVARTLRVARLFGLPAMTSTADGASQVSLQVAGSWSGWASGVAAGFQQPRVTGTARLRNVHFAIRGVDEPIEIASADLHLLPGEVKVTRLSVSAAHALWTGSLELPRGCGTPAACVVGFNLGTNEVGWSGVSQWVSPHPKDRPWYRVLASIPSAAPSFLMSLRASGKVSVNRFLIRDLVATHVSANVDVDSGRLRVSELRGELLGGKHRGEWRADFRVKPPVYAGTGSMSGVSLAHLADSIKDGSITGTASANYQVKASGASSVEFWNLAEGTAEFDLRDGVLPHFSLTNDAAPLSLGHFEGQARLHEGKLEIKGAQLTSLQGSFEVSGTMSLSRELDLKLIRSPMISPVSVAARMYRITGTLNEPRVASVAGEETQARLKASESEPSESLPQGLKPQ